MKRRIIAASLAVIMAASLYACDGKTEVATESDAEAVSSTVTETVTESQTSTTVSVTTTTTTEPTTAKPTTTKKITTTAKKVVTTVKKALTTEKPTTEAPTERRTKINSLLNKRTEDRTVTTELKYGVTHRQVITTYYQENEDGVEVAVREEVTADVYDRTLYYASYSDLLPAAKENRNTYRSEINEILRIINGYREEGGLKPLKLNEDLTIIACARAEEVAWSGNHNHTRPNLQSGFSLMQSNGFSKGLAGENIGWGFADAKSVCEAWKNSETHYENIMNPDFTEIGIGVAADADPAKKLCWLQYFYGA